MATDYKIVVVPDAGGTRCLSRATTTIYCSCVQHMYSYDCVLISKSTNMYLHTNVHQLVLIQCN